ncbi:DEAD/DEAH box helicase family protein [Campylobacter sp. VBCF_05 NA6]|uniref:DEAD/DEAH box helicase family protein n=1 Tax=unclassified Campylobacter TaxID=2593542 RepID=UPI0022E9C854|nr:MULTISPECIES: DEAD/DEAH box helicase family protein [unclassified Campylobacter]MDA3056949.1 DEAD/DEAH box helicase family protein [Campylobacter sp. VBCF_04 NA7]MDA3058717.1 DEAD/DEAH box helicase family protein [Campylobacter sp. VBCF_05 NA6]
MVKNLFSDEKIRLGCVLQNFVESELGEFSAEFDFESFSENKKMYDYQICALKNAFRLLNFYFNECNGDKKRLFNEIYRFKIFENLDLKVDEKSFLNDFYEVRNKRLEFANLINQMCFWMTMGSGKTIIIIKLIELLNLAMKSELIPKKNIYFFTASESLLESFKSEVEIYNEFKDNGKISVKSLKDYEKEKSQNSLKFDDEIEVFAYLAHNLTDESKEKQLDFKEILAGGENYVILDEAHKGDKNDSKRQNIMAILSQNGFLFNFSATFVSPQDITMTIYNLNQVEWVKQGYGKKPVLLDANLKEFRNKDDLNENAKIKSLMQSLLLLTLCKKYKAGISQGYHEPMMVVFANSVSVENADAEIFFKTLNLVLKSENLELFESAKSALKNELKTKNYLISDGDDDLINFSDAVGEISLNELKKAVFYEANGNLEALISSKNKNEIAFKLDTTEKPFLLVRIGNISSWIKEKLTGIKITQKFDSESMFENIDDSSINILLGSRMFSEGWDSVRPNVVAFLNIGMDSAAKKFVIQSMGRSMRVQSFDGSRQRAKYMKFEVDFNSVKALETTFIIATNQKAVKEILEFQEKQKEVSGEFIELELNENIKDKELLIPVYKNEFVPTNKLKNLNSKIHISAKNMQNLRDLINNQSVSLFALNNEIFDKEKYEKMRVLANDSASFCVDENVHFKDLKILVEKFGKKMVAKVNILSEFKELKNEIIHYKRIRVNSEKKDEIKAFVELSLSTKSTKSIKAVKYRYLQRHYYNPLISGDSDLGHIVKVPSEITFLDELEKICHKFDEKYEWWYFSKLVENVDDIFVPYINNADEHKFCPDFIFWLQPYDGEQKIVFVDPKGTEHIQGYLKIDGFKEIFGKDNSHDRVKLFLVNVKDTDIADEYENYWIGKDEIEKIFF